MDEAWERYRALLTPITEIRDRILGIQRLLQEASLDGLLALQTMDLFYFSGTLQDGSLWIPCEGEPVLLVRRSLERARAESPLPEIHALESPKQLAHWIGQRRPSRIGLELDVLPAREFLRIQESLPEARFEDATPLIRRVRQIKSAFEIHWMREAGRREARVYQHLPRWIREGRSELEFSAEIERALRLEGHQGLVRLRRWINELHYGPVVSGTSACYPNYFDGPVGALGLCPAAPQGAGTRRIRRNEPVLVDISFGYNGYLVDKARTYSIGALPPEAQEAYLLCRRILEDALSRMKPGVLCSSIYREVMEPLEKHPFWPHLMGTGQNKVRFLAHGVGLELDEWPLLAPRFDVALAPGMTLALEPKIFLPGIGGIGLENTYVITDKDPEKLTDFPDDLVVIDPDEAAGMARD
jgi:Xaa-Pro dipeptidase